MKRMEECKQKRSCHRQGGICMKTCYHDDKVLPGLCKKGCSCCVFPDIFEDQGGGISIACVQKKPCLHTGGECKESCLTDEVLVPGLCKKRCQCCVPEELLGDGDDTDTDAGSHTDCEQKKHCLVTGGQCQMECQAEEVPVPGLCKMDCQCCLPKDILGLEEDGVPAGACKQKKHCFNAGGHCKTSCDATEELLPGLCRKYCQCCVPAGVTEEPEEEDETGDTDDCQQCQQMQYCVNAKGTCKTTCLYSEVALAGLCQEGCQCCVPADDADEDTGDDGSVEDCQQRRRCQKEGGECLRTCREGDTVLPGRCMKGCSCCVPEGGSLPPSENWVLWY
nr:proprotein convertase subtilisin/kexin type 5-like [Penaeus vannamei]